MEGDRERLSTEVDWDFDLEPVRVRLIDLDRVRLTEGEAKAVGLTLLGSAGVRLKLMLLESEGARLLVEVALLLLESEGARLLVEVALLLLESEGAGLMEEVGLLLITVGVELGKLEADAVDEATGPDTLTTFTRTSTLSSSSATISTAPTLEKSHP